MVQCVLGAISLRCILFQYMQALINLEVVGLVCITPLLQCVNLNLTVLISVKPRLSSRGGGFEHLHTLHVHVPKFFLLGYYTWLVDIHCIQQCMV